VQSGLKGYSERRLPSGRPEESLSIRNREMRRWRELLGEFAYDSSFDRRRGRVSPRSPESDTAGRIAVLPYSGM
jgi:hypothetical protein